MNVSEEFAEIRKQFQELHTELDQYMLFMDVCHWPDDKTQSESAAEHCKVPFELLGLMHIPIVHPKHHQYLFKEDPLALFNEFAAASSDELNRRLAQNYIVGFPDADQRPPRRLKVAYLRCPNETTRQAAHEYRTLAKQAGASLPSVVLDAIPTLFDTNSYVDRWLEFVFWQNPPSLEDLLHLNCTLNTHIYRIPCEDSARAIAECGLDTTSPVFRPRKGQWPVWAGFAPLDVDLTGGPPTLGSTDFQEKGAGEPAVEVKPINEELKKVKRPKRKAIASFKLSIVLGTQSDIAEAVYKDRKKQWQVSRDIKAVENYLQSCGVPKENWLATVDKPEFVNWDPATIDLGKRQDGHVDRQREKFEEYD